jgi:hypothetical protein
MNASGALSLTPLLLTPGASSLREQASLTASKPMESAGQNSQDLQAVTRNFERESSSFFSGLPTLSARLPRFAARLPWACLRAAPRSIHSLVSLISRAREIDHSSSCTDRQTSRRQMHDRAALPLREQGLFAALQMQQLHLTSRRLTVDG